MKCECCDKGMVYLDPELSYCPNCFLISSERPPDPTIYDKSYHVKYLRYARSPENTTLQSIRLDTIRDCVVFEEFPSLPSLLDYGCGSGAFMEYARGWRSNINAPCFSKVTGYDVNPYSGYADPGVLLAEHDIVTFWDSLEHLAHPGELLRSLKAEYVFISTPNAAPFIGNGIPTMRKITGWHHFYPEEHVHYFCRESLVKLLAHAGYELIGTHYGESTIRTTGGPENIITVGGRCG